MSTHSGKPLAYRGENHNPMLATALAGQAFLERQLTGWQTRTLRIFPIWLTRVFRSKSKTDVYNSYGAFSAMIAKEHHCHCDGSCSTCEHLAKDAWRAEI